MTANLYLTVSRTPAVEELPALRGYLDAAFPHRENRAYLSEAEHSPLPRVRAERLGALALLPPLLEGGGIDPSGLILRRDGQGRPYCATAEGELPFCGLTGAPTPFDFNLSHSATHVAAALLLGDGRVGLDVEEPIPPARALPLIRRYCTRGELDLLGSLPHDDPPAAATLFTSLWTIREAIAKQAGTGMPLRFDATALPNGVTLTRAILPDTDAALSLCAPSGSILCLHPRSLPLILK